MDRALSALRDATLLGREAIHLLERQLAALERSSLASERPADDGSPLTSYREAVSHTPSSTGALSPARGNQDRFMHGTLRVGPRMIIVDAVVDGHGGGRFAAEFLREHAVEWFEETLRRQPDPETVPLNALLKLAIGRLEHALLRELVWLEHNTSGAVASFVLTELVDGRLRLACGNVGDCDVKLVDHEGKSTALSQRHRATEPAEIQRLQLLGGKIEAGRLLHAVSVEGSPAFAKGAAQLASLEVTRGFGDYQWKRETKGILNKAELGAVSFNVQDTIARLYSLYTCEPFVNVLDNVEQRWCVLGSDGFWDACSDLEGLTACMTAEALAQHARQNVPLASPHADDIAVVVIDLFDRLSELQRHHSARRRLAYEDHSEDASIQ